jgi:hypothetical protein
MVSCTAYVRYWPKADIASCTAHVRFRGQSRHDVWQKSAFSVAIGGKADMGLCTAYVGFGPRADMRPGAGERAALLELKINGSVWTGRIDFNEGKIHALAVRWLR